MKVEEIKLAFENNQKFELALIDDIKSFISKNEKKPIELKQAIDSIKINEPVYNKALNDYKKSYYDSVRAMSNSEGVMAWFQKTDSSIKANAKELGIDVYSVNGYKQMENLYNDIIASRLQLSPFKEKGQKTLNL